MGLISKILVILLILGVLFAGFKVLESCIEGNGCNPIYSTIKARDEAMTECFEINKASCYNESVADEDRVCCYI